MKKKTKKSKRLKSYKLKIERSKHLFFSLFFFMWSWILDLTLKTDAMQFKLNLLARMYIIVFMNLQNYCFIFYYIFIKYHIICTCLHKNI